MRTPPCCPRQPLCPYCGGKCRVRSTIRQADAVMPFGALRLIRGGPTLAVRWRLVKVIHAEKLNRFVRIAF